MTMYEVPDHGDDILIGVDLGQAQDPTAIIIASRVEKLEGGYDEKKRRWRTKVIYEVPQIIRPPLGTRYPVIVKILKAVIADIAKMKPERVSLLVDTTGVGRPVVDDMQDEGLHPIPILITGGHHVNIAKRTVNVPKKVLVSSMSVLMGEHRFKVSSKLEHAETLTTELQTFRMKMTTAGNQSFEAWRDGDHDDLVLAACMIAWWGENRLKSLLHQPPPPKVPIRLKGLNEMTFNDVMKMSERHPRRERI